MNKYKSVKEAVSTKEAASFYGINVNRNGMCCCPFHNDKHPSMKVDSRYHCFACGEDGDVINFVAKLFNLSPNAAAEKIINDFHITSIQSNLKKATLAAKSNPQPSSYDLQRAFQSYRRDALLFLHEYLDVLSHALQDLAPVYGESLDKCNPLYEEAVNNYELINYLIDELTFSSEESQINLLTTYERKLYNMSKTDYKNLNNTDYKLLLDSLKSSGVLDDYLHPDDEQNIFGSLKYDNNGRIVQSLTNCLVVLQNDELLTVLMFPCPGIGGIK